MSAEIIAQAKSEKVTVFKKRRRHNYRRKAGHRQQLTLLRILSVGDAKAPTKAAAAEAPNASDPAPVAAQPTPEAETKPKAAKAQPAEGAKITGEKPAAKKPVAKKPAAKSKSE